MTMKKLFVVKRVVKNTDSIWINAKTFRNRKNQTSKILGLRVLSILFTICLVSSLVCNVFALSATKNTQSAEQVINLYSNNKEVKYTISSQKTIFGISGDSTYTIYKLKPYGFAILLDETNSLMEACYAENAVIPIDTKSDDQYYYGGPGVYCVRQNGNYLNTFDGEILSYDDIYHCGQLERSAAQYELSKSDKIASKTGKTDAKSNFMSHSVAFDYFMDLDKYGTNVDGTCTVIATAMLLGYYDNFVDEDFVPTQYEDGNGTSEAFHQLLNQFVYGNSPAGGIFIHDALPGINAYLIDRMIWATMESEYTSQTSAINSMINNLAAGVPVIASMGTHVGAAYDHTVLVYEIYYIDSDPTGTASVTVNMGWGDTINDDGQFNTVYTTSAGWFYECGYLQYH